MEKRIGPPHVRTERRGGAGIPTKVFRPNGKASAQAPTDRPTIATSEVHTVRRTFDKPLLIGVGLMVALLLLIAGHTYKNTRQLNEDARWVAHTHEVLNLSSELMLSLVDAETGQRGFLITGKDEFLQPYEVALVRLDGLMAQLKDKTKGNSAQQARVTKLEEMAAVWLGQMKELVDLRRKDEKAAQAFVLTRKPKLQMDAIRRHVAEMAKVEGDLLKEREKNSAQTYQVAVTTGLLTALVGLVLLGAVVWLLNRSLRTRQQAAAVIAEHGERLRVTLASIGDAVITADIEGRITNMNAVAESLTGWTTAEAMGQPLEAVFRIVNETTRKSVESPVTRALKEGTIVGLANHTVLIAKDGTERPIDDSAAPIRTQEGEIVGCVLVFRDVTERHHLEQQNAGWLTDARLLASIVDSSEDAIISKSLDGVVQSWNAAAERLFGYRAEQAVGSHISFLIPADRAQEEDQIIARLRAGERVQHYDTVRMRSDGRPVHVSLTISPVMDAEGRVVMASKIVRDITERRQAEEALRRSEQNLADFFENANVGLHWVGPDGIILRANRAELELLGYPAEEYVGHHIAEFHADQPVIESILTGLTRGDTLRDYPARLRCHDGSIREVLINSSVLREDGKFIHTRCFTRDVTAQRRTDKALHESEERYRAAIAAVSDLIWTNNADGLMESEQQGWGDFTGQSWDEYRGYGWSKAVHPEDAQPTIDEWNLAVAEKRVFVFEHRVRRRDGQWRLCSVRAVPILNGDGTIREWVGVHTDITERKRDEEELRQLAADLSEAQRRKDEFLATLAHELRNPLAPIRNGLQLLKLAGGEVATVEQARSMMERQLTQMVRLVDDLMDVSRISRGKLELRKEWVQLAEVVNSAVETSHPLIEQLGHELSVTLPKHPLIIDADTTRLAQVFLNLLNNAAKYGERGGHIQLNVEPQGSDVVVTVKDTGIGIDADQLLRIFEMFAQVDRSLEKSQGGLGIGLTLAKRLVEMHGGSVEARSEGSGKGSEFIVRLPLVIEASKPQESGGAAEKPAKSSLRILIVDDNRDGADSLAMMLRIMGNDTRTAYDGQEGVDVAGEFPSDVILLDIGLPKLNGYEACRRIRKQSWGKGVVLIAVTGWGQDEDRRRSHEAGFDHHLVKPVDPQALMKLLAGVQVAKR